MTDLLHSFSEIFMQMSQSLTTDFLTSEIQLKKTFTPSTNYSRAPQYHFTDSSATRLSQGDP
jgi:hypothetical protein